MRPEVLGDYRIIKELGRGGMGVVYLAEHLRLQKKYALKILPQAFSESPELVHRFHTEARVMAELNHPNIVKVVNMSCVGTTYYLVMEYIASETGEPKNLHHYQRERGGVLPEDEVERIAVEILSALDYAHSYSSKAAPMGIIHRDIKPANVLLDEKRTAKVSDFGLAKILAGDKDSATRRVTLTANGAILGTYDFMSPEQKAGKKVDARTDIYAIGVMIYSALTGKKPEGRFPLPSQINPQLSKKWDSIVDKCLQYLPEDRFQNANEVIKAIKSKEKPKPEKIKKAKKEKKVHRGWFAEVIKWTAIVFIVMAVLSTTLIVVSFKYPDFLKMFKSSAQTAIREESKKDETLPEIPSEPEVKKPAEEIKTGTIPEKQVGLSEDFFKILGETATALAKKEILPVNKELTEQYKNLSNEETMILDVLTGFASEFVKPKAGEPFEPSKDLPGAIEKLKERGLTIGPLKIQWESAIKKMEEANQLSEQGKATEAMRRYQEAQREMRTLYGMEWTRQRADKMKSEMAKAKQEVDEILPQGAENVLYRIATKTERDAENAYQKGDYPAAKTLYSIAADVFNLSQQDCEMAECFTYLKNYVEKKKAAADALNAPTITKQIFIQATRLKQQGDSFFGKKDYQRAANSYVQSAYHYERARERAALSRLIKVKDK